MNLSSQLKVRGALHTRRPLYPSQLPLGTETAANITSGVTGREAFRSLRLEEKSAEIGWEDGHRGNSHKASAQAGGFGRRCCCCGRYRYQLTGPAALEVGQAGPAASRRWAEGLKGGRLGGNNGTREQSRCGCEQGQRTVVKGRQ